MLSSAVDLTALFFILGVLAKGLKSNLSFDEKVISFLTSYLLIAIGIKGGYAFASSQISGTTSIAFIIGLSSTLIIPLVFFRFFKSKIGNLNAASLGACYGSVSVVTFVAASQTLKQKGIEYSDYNIVLMALMEIPAIILGITLALKASENRDEKIVSIAKSVITSKSLVLLVGSFIIGLLINANTWTSLKFVFVDAFGGILAIYLLDLGINAYEKLKYVYENALTSIILSVLAPFAFGTTFMFLGLILKINIGDAVLLGVLTGSASYIAAPACLKSALPRANSALYTALPLSITFPFNLFIGIPLYIFLANFLHKLLNL